MPFITHLLDLRRPALSGTMFRNRCTSFACQQLRLQKYLCRYVSDVFVAAACKLSRRAWLANLINHLFARFIHTYHWVVGII
jgi:hypothetical protein